MSRERVEEQSGAIRDDALLVGTAQIFNRRPHDINIAECRIARQNISGFVYPDGGNLASGAAGKESQVWNYYDDQNISVLLRFTDLGTGSSFWAERESELGKGSNRPMKIIVDSTLIIEHADGRDETEWKQ